MQISNKKIKVAIIEPVGGHGGMDYYDYGLAYGLGNNNVKVDFYTSDVTKIRNFKNVFTFLVFKNIWGRSSLIKLFLFIKYFHQAVRMSRRRGSKIVHLHFFSIASQNLIALLIAKIYKMKIVVTIHDVDPFHRNNFKWIESVSFNLLNGIIVHNKSSYNELAKKKQKLPVIAIIPHGNYLPFIKPFNLNNSVKKDHPFRLLFFGQIKEVKGLDILLEALGKIKGKGKSNFKLTIAGKIWKDDFYKYNKIIKKKNLINNVKLDVKYIPDDEISNFFEKTDLVILPYKRIYQSGVLLKAISYKKAVLVSNLEAFMEIINDGENGYVFESENPDSLARKIVDIIKHKEELPMIAQKGFEYVKNNHDWVDIGKLTLDVYRAVL